MQYAFILPFRDYESSTAILLVWNLAVLGRRMEKIMAQQPKAMLVYLQFC